LEDPSVNPRIDADLSDPRHFADGPPHEIFAALRERDPVHHNPVGFVGEEFWSLTRWEDIAAASKDTATYSSTDGSTIPGNAAMGDFTKLMMVNQDPPLHTQRRAIVSKVFTARAIAVQADVVHEVLTDLVDRVAEQGTCDLVRDITAPFPLFVIADMLGVPREDHEMFLRWSNAIGRLQGDDDSAGELATAMQEMGAYLAAFIASRRAEPQDDLISRLIHAELDGVQLSDAELMVSFAEIMVAGNETTRNTLAGALWLLIEHPDQLAALRADPGLAENAAEEVLRHWTPNVYQARTLTRDVSLHGRQLRRGERIAMWLCSANRDPAVHKDPDRLDIRRADPRHMSFGGGGRHFCLGAGLARLELGIGLRVLLDKLDDLELDGTPTRIPHTFFHALDSMPIRFAPARAKEPAR
jgi:linalool 8-monooxygenase